MPTPLKRAGSFCLTAWRPPGQPARQLLSHAARDPTAQTAGLDPADHVAGNL